MPWINLNSQQRNADLSKKSGVERGCPAGTTLSVVRRWPISLQQLECDWLVPYHWIRFTQTRFYRYFIL